MKTLALVGRPNVGKSTLFNRIVGRRRAIVDRTPGTTRDRIEDLVSFEGRGFRLIDTAGLGLDAPETFLREVEDQVALAVEVADRVILVVDAREGLVSIEEEIARRLRKAGKDFLVAANKAEGRAAAGAADFHRLGVEVFPISAEHNLGIEELLAAATRGFPRREEDRAADGVLRLALAGRPNVGKSMMFNRLLGDDRAVVSETPGTTRDATVVRIETADGPVDLIDTAGLRRGRTGSIERAARAVAESALRRADVAAVLVDATVGVTRDDRRVVERALSAGAGVVLAVNKWDLVEREAEGKFQAKLAAALGRASHVPYVVTSGKTGRGLDRLLDAARSVAARRANRIPTAEVNRILARLAEEEGVKYVAQVGVQPPRFVVFARKKPRADLVRRVENELRAAGDFAGVPLCVEMRFSGRLRKAAAK